MPTLNDYLGSIVSGINQARAMADVESANLARNYAEDDLLKNFSVPRFRASNIELTIPVAMEETPKTLSRDYQPIDNRSFNSISYTELKNVYKVDSFKSATSKLLKAEVASCSDKLEKEIKAGEDKNESLQRYAKRIADVSYKFITADVNKEVLFKRMEVEKTGDVIAITNQRLIERLAGEIREPQYEEKPEQTNVVIEAAKLREQRPDTLVYIKMNLTEEGMEWQTMKNQDGETVTKLTPE